MCVVQSREPSARETVTTYGSARWELPEVSQPSRTACETETTQTYDSSQSFGLNNSLWIRVTPRASSCSRTARTNPSLPHR